MDYEIDCLKVFRAILMHKNRYKNLIKWREIEKARTRKRLVFLGLIKGGVGHESLGSM